MADIGDDATAAGMDLVPGSLPLNQIDTEENKTRDYIAQFAARKQDKLPGGAAPARIEPGSAHSIGFYTLSASTLYFRPVPTTADYDRKVITQQELDAAIAAVPVQPPPDLSSRVAKSGDTMTGNLFLPNSSAASSGWTNAYINVDGRVCRGASSLRYKKFVRAWDPMALGDIFPTFHRFQMKADGISPAEGKWRYGPIAEDMAAKPEQAPFVVYREIDGEVVPDSVDFNALSIAQVAQLHERALVAEARIANLNERLAALEDKAA